VPKRDRSIADRLRGPGAALALVAALALIAGPGAGHSRAAAVDGGEGAEASIIGGLPGSIEANPWLAFIAYKGEVEESGCGGSVVAPRLVLTAGHCVLTGTGRVAPPSNFAVLTGVANLKAATRESVSAVSRVLVFPGFNPSRIVNDAALLVLAEPVAAPAVSLATSADEALLAQGATVGFAGWGLTSFYPQRFPALFREGESLVRSAAGCRRSLRRAFMTYTPSSQICGRSQARSGPGLCNGDSGGPAIARRADGSPVQIGIVSLKGAFDCNTRSPQVLARVDRVSPWVAAWIAAIVGDAAAPAGAKPRLVLPPMSRESAEFVVGLGLEAAHGSRFTRGRGHRIGCRRLDREKVKCRILWLRGRDLYEGGITAYTALPREGSIYNYRYTIRRFDFRCWLSSRHPIRACSPRVFKR